MLMMLMRMHMHNISNDLNIMCTSNINQQFPLVYMLFPCDSNPEPQSKAAKSHKTQGKQRTLIHSH